MKKIFSVVLAAVISAMLLVSLLPLSVFANPNNSLVNDDVDVLHFSTAPNIDGIITTGEWGSPTASVTTSGAATSSTTTPTIDQWYYTSGHDSAYSYDLWLRWDTDYFYIGVKVEDPDGHMLKATKDYTWNGDAIQFRIDPEGPNASSNGNAFNYSNKVKPWGTYADNDFCVGFNQGAGGYSEVWNNALGYGCTSYSNPAKGACLVGISPSGEGNSSYASYSADAANGITTYEIAVPWAYIDTDVLALDEITSAEDLAAFHTVDGTSVEEYTITDWEPYGMSLAVFNGTPGGTSYNQILSWGSGLLGVGDTGGLDLNKTMSGSAVGSNAINFVSDDAGGMPTSGTKGGYPTEDRNTNSGNWLNDVIQNYYLQSVNGSSKTVLDFNDSTDLDIFGGEIVQENKYYSGERVQDSDGNWVCRFDKNFDIYENAGTGYNDLTYICAQTTNVAGSKVDAQYPDNFTYDIDVKVTGNEVYADGYDSVIDFWFGGVNGAAFQVGYNFTDSAFEWGGNVETSASSDISEKSSGAFSLNEWHKLRLQYDNETYTMRFFCDDMDTPVFSTYDRYFYYSNLSDTVGTAMIIRRLNVQCEFDNVAFYNFFAEDEGIPAVGTLYGTSTSYGDDETAVTTIRLYKGIGENVAADPSYETTVTGTGTKNYIISGINGGEYTVRVTKKDHVTREYTVGVGAFAATELNILICEPGDINGDGFLNAKDLLTLRKFIVNDMYLSDYQMSVADLCDDNGTERMINSKDVLLLRKKLVRIVL